MFVIYVSTAIRIKERYGSSSSAFPAISLGFTILGEILQYVTVLQSNHIGSHIPSSWIVHAGCVFLAGIHPTRTWMSGSFDSVRWNVCEHRLDLSLYSSKRVLGYRVRTHVNSKGENPLYRKNPSQRRVEPTTLHHAGKRVQHTTNGSIPAPRYGSRNWQKKRKRFFFCLKIKQTKEKEKKRKARD